MTNSQLPRLIRAVAFDLDGLMFNTEVHYEAVGQELMRRRGHVFTKELRDKMMGRPPPGVFQVMIDEHGLSDQSEAMALESDQIFRSILDESLDVMPGLLDLLDLLESRRIPKGIATSSRRTHVDYVLGRFDLTTRFNFIISAENVTHGKPHPEIYLNAAKRHGVDPRNMLVLEDSQAGCRAALAAGAVTVAVPGPHNEGHDYTGVAFIATSLADVRIQDLICAEGVEG
jgi:HAD superfamily hydrolase (TIGR01509 family)